MLFSVRDTASKSEVGSDRRQHLMSVSGLQTHTCTPKRVHMCSTHTYTHTNFKMVTKLKPCKACGGTQCDGPAPTRKGWGPWIYPSWPRGTTSPTLLFSFLTVVIKSSNVSSFFFKFIFSQYANRNGFQWLLFQCNSFRKSKNAKHVCVYGNVDGRSIRRGHLCFVYCMDVPRVLIFCITIQTTRHLRKV